MKKREDSMWEVLDVLIAGVVFGFLFFYEGGKKENSIPAVKKNKETKKEDDDNIPPFNWKEWDNDQS